MYWDYNFPLNNKYLSIIYIRLFSVIMLLFIYVITFSQDVTSPYSILGIGDIDIKEYGRYFSSGGTSIARRTMNGYNSSNPASLTALPLKTMNYDFNFKGVNARYTYPTSDTSVGIPSNDISIRRLALAFKINDKTALAAGIKPYSTVNYRFMEENVILDGNSSYRKLIDGSGGINQFYVSLGKTVNKHVSIGVTASWLFGSIMRTTDYFSQSLFLNIQKKETNFYTGAQIQGGLQYYSNPKRKWVHHIGFTSSISTNLNGEYVREYTETGEIVEKEILRGKSFKLPITIGIGYSITKNEALTFSMDANYHNWSYQKVDYTASYTNPNLNISTGIEYSFKQKFNGAFIEKSYLSAGLSYENHYIRIRNNNLSQYAFYLGGGTSISRNIFFNGALSFGTKGDKALGQIKENFTQYTIGFTLRDIWLGPKYTRRYD